MMDKVEVRRQAILKMLEQSPMIMVSELASSLHVTMKQYAKISVCWSSEGLLSGFMGGLPF